MVVVIATFTAVATPHALVLPVSHGSLLCQPPSFAAALLPLLLVTEPSLASSIAKVVGHRQRARIAKSRAMNRAVSHRGIEAEVTTPRQCSPHHRYRRGVA
jgi:hypothetical protein